MTIKEVSEKFGISADTLRYYEKVGLIGPITKTNSGIRNYNENDLNQIEFVKCMRAAEMPITILKEYLTLYAIGDKTIEERRNLLLSERKKTEIKLEEIKKALKKINYKIDLYDQQLLEKVLEGKNE